MSSQVVEITQTGYWLTKWRGFLQVRSKGEKVGQIPLDDILTVIISVPGCSLSTVLIDVLSQRNIPLVMCGNNFLPSSITLPVQGNNRQFQVMRNQTKLSEPRRKRAWQKIVRAKILNQAEVLKLAGHNINQLKRLAAKVRSGDPDNCEAQAARLYWQQLFGKQFRRVPESGGLNAILNYTYAVVRACVARGASGAGLHPSFSLHHKNPQNPLNLVDDLMEPFRPFADCQIWKNKYSERSELTPKTKAKLASITTKLISVADEISPFSLAALRTCRSLATYCSGESNDLLLPDLSAIDP